jgi:hypothetical protein
MRLNGGDSKRIFNKHGGYLARADATAGASSLVARDSVERPPCLGTKLDQSRKSGFGIGWPPRSAGTGGPKATHSIREREQIDGRGNAASRDPKHAGCAQGLGDSMDAFHGSNLEIPR